MTKNRRAGVLALLGIVAVVVARLAEPDGRVDDLALLGTGIVLGEVLVLRVEDRSAVPLSFAVMLVAASSFDFAPYVLTVLAAQLVAYLVRVSETTPTHRLATLTERIAVAAATFGAYQQSRALLDHRETVAAVLGVLGATAAVQWATDWVVRRVLRAPTSVGVRNRLAWLAIASSGILMTVGYRGIDGDGRLGLWGPVLFATPLLAAWYAYERLDAATLAYRQTIESLAMAPEFGGLVLPGHAQRVAALASAIGAELGFSANEVDDLEKAALLHHLGQVTLEDPEVAGRPDPAEVAGVTSAMLREIRPLAGAGRIIAGDADDESVRLAAAVLKVASAYDDITAGDGTPSDVALETLRSVPGYAYEPRALVALERTVRSRRVSR